MMNRVNFGLFINFYIKVFDWRVMSLQWRMYDNLDVYGSINWLVIELFVFI